MPQIGWSEILVIILVAIIVIGPKDLPIVVRKFIQIKNAIKNYVNSFQKSIDDIVEEHDKDIKKITDLNIEDKDKDKSDKS
jgi:sec-independent protein translocase protein TatB